MVTSEPAPMVGNHHALFHSIRALSHNLKFLLCAAKNSFLTNRSIMFAKYFRSFKLCSRFLGLCQNVTLFIMLLVSSVRILLFYEPSLSDTNPPRYVLLPWLDDRCGIGASLNLL